MHYLLFLDREVEPLRREKEQTGGTTTTTVIGASRFKKRIVTAPSLFFSSVLVCCSVLFVYLIELVRFVLGSIMEELDDVGSRIIHCKCYKNHPYGQTAISPLVRFCFRLSALAE